jgi:hypothetical protein
MISAQGQKAAAKAQQAALDWEAKQLEAKGKIEEAMAQREGQEQKHEKEMALSTLQARSAASGFSATDPSTLDIAENIEKYGTYKQQLAQTGGKARRAGYEMQAQGKRMEGRAGVTGAKYAAMGTILGGMGGMFKAFGSSGGGSSGGGYFYG